MLWEKNVFIFLLDHANPTQLYHVIRLYLVALSCLLLVKAAGLCFPLAGKSCKLLRTPPFLSLTNTTLFGILTLEGH
jgi:hypothetical protein